MVRHLPIYLREALVVRAGTDVVVLDPYRRAVDVRRADGTIARLRMGYRCFDRPTDDAERLVGVVARVAAHALAVLPRDVGTGFDVLGDLRFRLEAIAAWCTDFAPCVALAEAA